ncbi:MAG: hypothetical protein OXU79_02020 [Gemmatimonadota bacterium]|nr:hypothetical protein [Gemmatimonadota bacterium]
MTHEASFGIRTARDFLREMVIPQYDDFVRKNSSSRHALIAIILSYHMYEWVHRNKGFSCQHFEVTYPDDRGLAEKFDLARKISNGTKHFKPKVKTQTGSGFASAFNDGFARPLNVITNDGMSVSVDVLLRDIVDFWKRLEERGVL